MKLEILYPNPYRKYLHLTGVIGVLASLVVGAGEFLVHFAGNAIHSPVAYSFFHSVPAARLPMGHFLLVAGLPLYVIGYMHLFLALAPGSRRLASAVFVIGIYSFMIGGIWVGSRAFLGSLIQLLDGQIETTLMQQILASYEQLIESLVQVLRVLVLANSTLIVYTILRTRTLYPRWMAFFNPIFLLVLVFLSYFLLPTIGDFLVPTAMNVAHLVMFSISLVALRVPLKRSPA
ncbi:MAG: hypothetical protein K8J08_06345 [Thermoanaerobaculia bacterium]|nr:hypothetical protein [Thermoanaerobaculia bacterium]